MEVEKIDVEKIKPNEYNPNVMDKRIYNTLVQNIKRFGEMSQPILVRPLTDGTFVIIDGFHRWSAAKDAGLESIYCAIPKSEKELELLKSPTFQKQMTLAFNRIHGVADRDKLKSIVNELEKEIGIDELIKTTAYEEADINRILADASRSADEIVKEYMEKGYTEDQAMAMAMAQTNVPEALPETNIQGNVTGVRNFITFYFEDAAVCEGIKAFFKKEGLNEPDTEKLIELVKEETDKG
jgi:hypothetical protein